MSKRYYTSPGIIIEICPREPRASACLPDGREVSEDPATAADLAYCTQPGDCEPFCEYVRDRVGVDWRIVARNDAGEYENREATDAEMQATCEAIYFDSSTDFTDRDTCETYLIWEAAHDARQSTGD
jgi:hypothetical protein